MSEILSTVLILDRAKYNEYVLYIFKFLNILSCEIQKEMEDHRDTAFNEINISYSRRQV